MSEAGKRKKFVFNTRGKITKKESKELQRTHNNIFDWVQKEKSVLAEKNNFEKKEEVELEVESMEVESMEVETMAGEARKDEEKNESLGSQ